MAADGVPTDPALVNVAVSGGSTGTLALARVDTAADCVDAGWYYDDNDAPSRVIACLQTCDAINRDGHTAVDILLGCATVVK